MPKSYVPPHKREKATKGPDKGPDKVKVPDKIDIHSFPQLVETKPVEESKMDFARLFKNVINSTKKKPMKKGLVLLTKTKVIDSLTPEERLEEDRYWEDIKLQTYLSRCVQRLDKQKIERREYDFDYVSEEEIIESDSEEEVEETEEEEEEEDFLEDEFEDEI
jgi:hypothetical protein